MPKTLEYFIYEHVPEVDRIYETVKRCLFYQGLGDPRLRVLPLHE